MLLMDFSLRGSHSITDYLARSNWAGRQQELIIISSHGEEKLQANINFLSKQSVSLNLLIKMSSL